MNQKERIYLSYRNATSLPLDSKSVRNDGITALHASAATANSEQIKSLIASGMDVNARDKYGNTPLHATSLVLSLTHKPNGEYDEKFIKRVGNMDEAVIALLKGGADETLTNQQGLTPLQCFQSRLLFRGEREQAWRDHLALRDRHVLDQKLAKASSREFLDPPSLAKGDSQVPTTKRSVRL